MEKLFITNLTIEKVRHLKDISIPLSEKEITHLILTGKNGSGKTSVLEALAGYLNNEFTDRQTEINKRLVNISKSLRNRAIYNGEEESEITKWDSNVYENEKALYLSLLFSGQGVSGGTAQACRESTVKR